MRTHIVIPARLASTRLPNKPLLEIDGVPMIVRVVQQASLADVDDVIAAVDDQAVLQAVLGAGHDARLTAEDHASGSDRVHQVAAELDWDDDDLVVNVQGDEPLVPPAVIDALVSAMRERPEVELGTVSEPLQSATEFLDPNAVKVVVDRNDHALYFSRAPIPFAREEFAAASESSPAHPPDLDASIASGLLRRHVGMYAFRVRGLKKFVTLAGSHLEEVEKLEQLRWLEAGERLLVMAHDSPIPGGVDTPADLERVRALFGEG